MNSIAKTSELPQQNNPLARPLGLGGYRKPFTFCTLLIAMSVVAVSAAIEIDDKLGFREIAAAETTMKPSTRVSFQNVVKGYRSGIREPLQAVVRSQAEWTAVWRRHSNELNSTPPTVLFDQEIVVAVFLGEKTTGGYDMTIIRAEQSDDTLVINYQEKTPAPGSMVIQVFMQPFHIVRMNREVGSKVTFRRES